MLKQHRPELVCVILTDHADAGTAIGLINKGQVYRYVIKPVHGTQCKIAVNSAVRHHQRLAHNPELTQRYEVEKTPEPPPASASAGLLNRIKSIRSLVRRIAS